MNSAVSPVFFGRPDTLLGVCEAIGRDLGFNPDFLRIGLGVGVIFNMPVAFAVYGAMALIVLLSRLAFPLRKVTKPVLAQPVATAPVAAPSQTADNDVDAELLALAA